mmetsp:Transcript_495/g.989  ORF Transcript_495/g.989 Transcript_495/m.989 type:complete len:261 (-) Transcript_495:238-1020(-)
MLNSGKLSQTSINRTLDDPNVSTLLMAAGLKRAYKSDLKPFDDIFTPKNLVLTVLKAAIIPMNSVVNEYNLHMIRSGNEDEDEMEDFDWEESCRRNSRDFLPNLYRVSTITVLKKSFEDYATKHFSDKFTDRLTKDVTKSIARKCERFTRFVACQKILRTAFWGNSLYTLSCFVFDIGNEVAKQVIACVNSGKDSKPVLDRAYRLVIFTGKKFIFYSVSLSCCALGHSVGTYFSADYGGMLGGFVFDIVGSVACGTLIGI